MINDELLQFIRDQRDAGTSDETIRSVLVGEGGWTDRDLEEAYDEIKRPTPKGSTTPKPVEFSTLQSSTAKIPSDPKPVAGFRPNMPSMAKVDPAPRSQEFNTNLASQIELKKPEQSPRVPDVRPSEIKPTPVTQGAFSSAFRSGDMVNSPVDLAGMKKAEDVQRPAQPPVQQQPYSQASPIGNAPAPAMPPAATVYPTQQAQSGATMPPITPHPFYGGSTMENQYSYSPSTPVRQPDPTPAPESFSVPITKAPGEPAIPFQQNSILSRPPAPVVPTYGGSPSMIPKMSQYSTGILNQQSNFSSSVAGAPGGNAPQQPVGEFSAQQLGQIAPTPPQVQVESAMMASPQMDERIARSDGKKKGMSKGVLGVVFSLLIIGGSAVALWQTGTLGIFSKGPTAGEIVGSMINTMVGQGDSSPTSAEFTARLDIGYRTLDGFSSTNIEMTGSLIGSPAGMQLQATGTTNGPGLMTEYEFMNTGANGYVRLLRADDISAIPGIADFSGSWMNFTVDNFLADAEVPVVPIVREMGVLIAALENGGVVESLEQTGSETVNGDDVRNYRLEINPKAWAEAARTKADITHMPSIIDDIETMKSVAIVMGINQSNYRLTSLSLEIGKRNTDSMSSDVKYFLNNLEISFSTYNRPLNIVTPRENVIPAEQVIQAISSGSAGVSVLGQTQGEITGNILDENGLPAPSAIGDTVPVDAFEASEPGEPFQARPIDLSPYSGANANLVSAVRELQITIEGHKTREGTYPTTLCSKTEPFGGEFRKTISGLDAEGVETCNTLADAWMIAFNLHPQIPVVPSLICFDSFGYFGAVNEPASNVACEI